MEIEKITGQGVKSELEMLLKQKTLIRLRVPGTGYQHLTLITGFRRKLNRQCFLADYTEGFKEAVADKPEVTTEFEYTGFDDNILRSFRVSGVEFYRDQLSFDLPQVIERHQRRKYFRLEAPTGTTIEFHYQDRKCSEKVVDISLGGVLIALVSFGDAGQRDLPFRIGDELRDVSLVFPTETGQERISVKRASVVRFDEGSPEANTCCGLHFIEIESAEVTALTDFIYTYQRRYLRTRVRPNR